MLFLRESLLLRIVPKQVLKARSIWWGIKGMTDFKIQPLWLGKLPVEASLQKQLDLKRQLLCEDSPSHGFFMGFEPESPIITKGLRSGREDVLWSESRLAQAGVRQISIKRGGHATLHSPGQLVIYPILPLAAFSLKVKDYIVALEEITQKVLLKWGVLTERLEEYAGLSTSRGKMAFFGVHISQGVSQHGLAVNVNNALHLFAAIKSCGVAQREHDSLSLAGVQISTRELFSVWIRTAQKFFQNQIKK